MSAKPHQISEPSQIISTARLCKYSRCAKLKAGTQLISCLLFGNFFLLCVSRYGLGRMEVRYHINCGKIPELDGKVQHLLIRSIPCSNISMEPFVRLTSLIQVRHFQSKLRNLRVCHHNCCNQCTSTTSHTPL